MSPDEPTFDPETQLTREEAHDVLDMIVEAAIDGTACFLRDSSGSIIVGISSDEPLTIGGHHAIDFLPLAILIDRGNGDRIINHEGLTIPDDAFAAEVEEFLTSLEDEG